MTDKIEKLAFAMEMGGVRMTLEVYTSARRYGIMDYIESIFLEFEGKHASYIDPHEIEPMLALLSERFGASPADCKAAFDLLTVIDLTPGHDPEVIELDRLADLERGAA